MAFEPIDTIRTSNAPLANDANAGGITINNGNGTVTNTADAIQSNHDEVAAANASPNPSIPLNAETVTANPTISGVTGTGSKTPTTGDIKTANSDNKLYYDRVTQAEVYKVPSSTGTGTSDVSEGKLVHSNFNSWSLVNYRGTPLQGATTGVPYGEYNQLDFNPDTLVNPTIQTIIERTSTNGGLGYRYGYSDFALCRYLGRIPNNHMITLRRFPFPIEDDIITPFTVDASGKKILKPSPDLSRAVTWMSEQTGNKIEDILGFSFKYNWDEVEAAVQTIENDASRRGKFGAFMNSSSLLRSVDAAANGKNAVQASIYNSASFDPITSTYPNYVFGPYNAITKMLQRKEGMDFDHEFTLTFEYEMRSLNGANPKIMFMDMMSQLLALTYSNAPFWGGAVRYTGGGAGSIGKPLGNAGLIANGDYKGFLGSVMKDLGTLGQNLIGDIKSNGLMGNNLTNNILGGSLLKLFNSPNAGQIVNAFLTGEATGQWHVTIGNPLNPIAVIGNLACTKTELNFKGPLGLQDFPEILELKVTLKPARPRDKAEIESMFNAGKGRFYFKPYGGPDINKTTDTDVYNHQKGGNDITGLSSYGTDEMRKFTNG